MHVDVVKQGTTAGSNRNPNFFMYLSAGVCSEQLSSCTTATNCQSAINTRASRGQSEKHAASSSLPRTRKPDASALDCRQRPALATMKPSKIAQDRAR